MTQIKLRRDTSANFTSKNPVLGIGEPAYETDTKKLKIGDGTTAYTQLEYFSAGGGGSTNITATLPLKIVDGVISLEVDGQTIQIVDGKLHANLDELSNTVNTLSDDVGTAFDLINIAQTDIQSNTENITNLQNALPNKQDKFAPELPLVINNTTIITTVPESVTETAESWTGGGAANSQVIVDISALNIDANSNWTLHLSGHMGDWEHSSTDTAHFNILTDKDTIFTFWHGSSHFRLGINTQVFNQVPAANSEFYYEITYQKDATQFTFNGPNLVSSDPLLISKMSQEMGQTPYTTLAGKGKLKSFGFPIFSKTFQRIDKDISKSYFEADGVKYPITSVQGVNTLKLGIGSGLSVVDGKLTAAGGSITTLATGYQDLPLPTREVWYKSPGNGYIAARFASTGANQFCQLGINSDGTGIPDSNSDYDGTQFSQGPNNKSTIILPISKDHYYSCNWNYGGGIIQLRFIQAINK